MASFVPVISGVIRKLEGALERGQPRRGRLEVLHAGGSQMKRRLRFLDLLIDGFDVAREIIAVQRQRHHKIAERLAHDGSPPSHSISKTKSDT